MSWYSPNPNEKSLLLLINARPKTPSNMANRMKGIYTFSLWWVDQTVT